MEKGFVHVLNKPFLFYLLLGKKTKRVGTMENVINDLNRFKKLNAQTMGNQQQQ